APPSPVASLDLMATASNTVSLTLNNAGDQVWAIQHSADLEHSSDVDSWKVHNGSFHRAFPIIAKPGLFYRAIYRLNEQSISSTVTNALLLPAVSFNYAAPILPPAFFTPAILAQYNMPLN